MEHIVQEHIVWSIVMMIDDVIIALRKAYREALRIDREDIAQGIAIEIARRVMTSQEMELTS